MPENAILQNGILFSPLSGCEIPHGTAAVQGVSLNQGEEVRQMEFIVLEGFVVGFGFAFTALLALAGVFTGITLAWLAEEEKSGSRLYWAEWPLPGKVEVAEKVELWLAA